MRTPVREFIGDALYDEILIELAVEPGMESQKKVIPLSLGTLSISIVSEGLSIGITCEAKAFTGKIRVFVHGTCASVSINGRKSSGEAIDSHLQEAFEIWTEGMLY